MSRIAVLSDVHGNVPALQAVLEDLVQQEIDEVLLGGDLVGRGPQGSRVVSIVRARGWRSIRGNHEDYLLDFRRGRIPEEWKEADVWSAARWMAAELSEDDLSYLESLPLTLAPDTMPAVRLVHGTPESNNEGIGPWTSERRMLAHLSSIEQSVLVCAHTHRPLERRFPAGIVLNTGSVGLPFNRDHRAQYLVLDGHGDRIEAEFRQVPYDLDQTLSIYETSGFLASGGATARLLYLELRHAAPHLVPFMAWTRSEGLPQELAVVDDFLAVYDHQNQREFFRGLRGSRRATVQPARSGRR